MLYDPKLDSRLDAINGRMGMVGVIEQSKNHANTLTEVAQQYEDSLKTLKGSKFYQAMKDLKENIIE